MGTIYTARARLAALKRHRDDNDPVVAAARRDLRAAKLARHINQVLDENTAPLSDAQRHQLAVTLLAPRSGEVA